MIADRRFDYGRDLELRGDLAGAADLFMQAIELAPDFASAWFALGDVRERQGDRTGAIDAFSRAKAANGADVLGADLRLLRLTSGKLAAMSPHYVTTLYDQYAAKFEKSLVGELYQAQRRLTLDAIQKLGKRKGDVALNWVDQHQDATTRYLSFIDELRTQPTLDYSMLIVALRQVQWIISQ